MDNFIGQKILQNCGDTLLILNKVDTYKNKYKGKFLNYSYEVIASKDNIIRGKVNNPQIEISEMTSQLWLQNCGDKLKVLRKSEEKSNGTYLWECKFIDYPCKILAKKACIINGQVNNPQIEKDDFIGHIFKQNCGNLKVLKKSDKIDNERKRYYFICQFEGYEEEILAFKDKILRGVVDNPYLIWRVKEKLERYIKENFQKKPTLEELAKKLNVSRQQLGQNIISFKLTNLIDYSFIKIENNIKEEIEKELNCKVEKYNDNRYEIDIYIPEKKLGIEYNGNFWHSDLNKKRLYHQEKSLYFKEKGIDILHIFEYEWLEKKDILIDIIKNKCGIFSKKIGASKCKIKEISNLKYQNFCNENHLQGEAGAKVKLGLFYKEELVQVMSFGVPRFTDKYQWEIIRECSKLGYRVIGGKEKLWSYFVKKYNPENCISYCDFSKFNGNSYLKIGFLYKQLNQPGFVWFNKNLNEIYWRNPYKNNELKKYSKIWDCGQLVFVWKN